MKVAELTLVWLAAKNQLSSRGHTPKAWLDDLRSVAPLAQPADIHHSLQITPIDDDWFEAEFVVWDQANPWVEPVVLRNKATCPRPLEAWAISTLAGLKHRHTKHIAIIVDYRAQFVDDARVTAIENKNLEQVL